MQGINLFLAPIQALKWPLIIRSFDVLGHFVWSGGQNHTNKERELPRNHVVWVLCSLQWLHSLNYTNWMTPTIHVIWRSLSHQLDWPK